MWRILPCLLFLPVGLAAQVTVNPITVVLQGDQPMSQVLTVVNHTDAVAQYRVYAEAFEHDGPSSFRYSEAEDGPRSCRERLTISPSTLEVEARGRGSVQLYMEPGDETCWNMIWVHTVADPAATGVVFATRVAAMVFGQPSGAGADLDLLGTRVVRTAMHAGGEPRPAVELTLSNRGNAVVRPTGRLEVWSDTGVEVRRVDVQAFTVLPGSERAVVYTIPPDLPGGNYLLIPVVDGGGPWMLADQVEFRVEP